MAAMQCMAAAMVTQVTSACFQAAACIKQAGEAPHRWVARDDFSEVLNVLCQACDLHKDSSETRVAPSILLGYPWTGKLSTAQHRACSITWDSCRSSKHVLDLALRRAMSWSFTCPSASSLRILHTILSE